MMIPLHSEFTESGKARAALLARDFAKAQEHLLRSLEFMTHDDLVEPLGPPPSNPKGKVGKYLYIPVEMAGRELASRAWIAGQCAKLGFNVVIGATWNLSAYGWRDFPPGIILFKTLYALDAKQFFLAKSHGHRVAVLDEEMMPLALTKRIYEFSIEPYALYLADLVCAPGEASAQILREMAPGKIAVTGNPRAMVRPVKAIRGHILVCTSAPTINPKMGFEPSMAMTLRVAGKPLRGSVFDIWQAQIKHEIKWTQVLLEAIEALKKKYGARVRVRPHPAEDPSTFEFEADHVPLSTRLSQADCVVFVSSCGIGIEAGMAGVPAVRIGTGGDGLSAAFGTGCESVAAALVRVEACLTGPETIPDLTNIIAEKITVPEELEKLWRENQDPDISTDILAGFHKRPRHYEPQEFQRNKFPETTAEQISELSGVPAVKIGWNLFALNV